jgi:hypothetical protein
MNSVIQDDTRTGPGLRGNNRDFKDPSGIDLQERTTGFFDWQQGRLQAGYWPYSRSLEAAPQANAQIKDCRGVAQQGVNFASQDYLSLATSAEVKDVSMPCAALKTIKNYLVFVVRQREPG